MPFSPNLKSFSWAISITMRWLKTLLRAGTDLRTKSLKSRRWPQKGPKWERKLSKICLLDLLRAQNLRRGFLLACSRPIARCQSNSHRSQATKEIWGCKRRIERSKASSSSYWKWRNINRGFHSLLEYYSRLHQWVVRFRWSTAIRIWVTKLLLYKEIVPLLLRR